MMDLKTTSFVGFLQERANKRKKPPNSEPANNNPATRSLGPWPNLSPHKKLDKSANSNNLLSNGQQQSHGFTRSQEIELKLDSALSESAFPRFEQLVEHLQGRKRLYDEDGLSSSDLLDSPVQLPRGEGGNEPWNSHFDLDDISIVSRSSAHKRRPSNMDTDELLFANKNFHLLLKELLPLIAQLLNLPDTAANQHIIEKATVYVLWVFFDSSSLNILANSGSNNNNNNGNNFHLQFGGMGPNSGGSKSSNSNSNNSSSNITSINLATLSSHYSHLEYLFCLDILNCGILERIGYVARSLFELMEAGFLNNVFYYPSMIRKAARDVEEQEVEVIGEQQDWFSLLEAEITKKEGESSADTFSVDPYENESFNFFPLNGEDKRRIEEASATMTNNGTFEEAFNFDYPNAEFILQALISENRLPMAADFANLNVVTNSAGTNENKFPEQQKQQIYSENYNAFAASSNSSSALQSPEDAITLLFSELATFIATYNSVHPGEPYYLGHEELFNAILSWIIANEDDETFGTELTNLLGEDSFSLITKIITFYKPNILKSSSTFLNGASSSANGKVNKNNNLGKAEHLWKMVCQAKGATGATGGPTNLGPSIVVHTEKEKELKKEMRKIEKRFNKELSKVQKATGCDADGFIVEDDQSNLTLADLERMREQNLKANIRAAFEPKLEELRPAREPVEQYPFVWDLLQTIKTTASYVGEAKLLLPLGVTKKDHRTHEEVSIPLIASNEATKEFLAGFPTIKIAETDDFVRLAFKGFTSLNLIQSTVYKTAYLADNENMLICAPTGAGKTNIAMLSILNILRAYSVDGISPAGGINLDQFKIVYIAPMKALCAEMTSSFGARLAPFGVKVRELTGDMQLTSKEILETQMLVVTPEKWDVVTRKSVGDVQLLDLVRLIVIDEVHLLQSDRGHVLETLVARTIRYVETAQKCIRLVGLSATLPSYVDVAMFLKVNLYKGLFVFDERFRPVPLEKTFIGVKGTNRMQVNGDMDEVTFGKVRTMLTEEEQVMVFVHSRNATLALAGFLLDRANYSKPEDDDKVNVSALFKADTDKLPFSEKIIARARYRNLNRLLLAGIGVHHAGMPRAERNIVEKLFRAGVIKVLVCTSTLAWGVNLPAHAVSF